MITKEDAIRLGQTGGTLYHKTLKNKDGTALRARVNGKCKTWKRDPDRWELPMRYGLREHFRIRSDGTYQSYPENWTELEPMWFNERKAKAAVVGLPPETPLCILRDAYIDRKGEDCYEAIRLAELIANGWE